MKKEGLSMYTRSLAKYLLIILHKLDVIEVELEQEYDKFQF